jgi:hypothetical protein
MTNISLGRESFLPFAGIERRTSVRHPCKVRVAVQRGSEETPWSRGTVLDVSVNGVRLRLPHAIAPGTTVTVALPRLLRGRRRLLQARVIYAAAGDDGAWAAGCTLIGDQFTSEELQSLPARR